MFNNWKRARIAEERADSSYQNMLRARMETQRFQAMLFNAWRTIAGQQKGLKRQRKLITRLQKPQGKTMDKNLSFSTALVFLKEGKKLQRVGWNGSGQYLLLQVPDEHSKMTKPYVYITTVQGDRVPWLASQTDLLADDWQTV